MREERWYGTVMKTIWWKKVEKKKGWKRKEDGRKESRIFRETKTEGRRYGRFEQSTVWMTGKNERKDRKKDRWTERRKKKNTKMNLKKY